MAERRQCLVIYPNTLNDTEFIEYAERQFAIMCGPQHVSLCRRPWLKPVELVQYKLLTRCLVSFYKSRDNKYELPKGPNEKKCKGPTGKFPGYPRGQSALALHKRYKFVRLF